MKTISTWMGVPLSEVPREELEREFVIAHRQIAMLSDRVCEYSIENMKLHATLARERLYHGLSPLQPAKPRLVHQILDFLFGFKRGDGDGSR